MERVRTSATLSAQLAFRVRAADPVPVWLEGLSALARSEGWLDLRLARLIAWIRQHDPAEVGFPSWAAWERERLPWRASWVRALVRLVNSPLERVKQAVCEGWLPLREAVRAPSEATPETEEAWLRGGRIAEARAPGLRIVVTGAVAERCRDARDRARMIKGRLPVAALDAWILARWRADTPRSELLGEAREASGRPFAPPRPGWCAAADPATALVGAWQEPGSLDEAIAQLDELVAARRGLVVTLGAAWGEVVRHRLWRAAGLPSAGELARELLGRSERTLQRYRRLAAGLEREPEVRRELARQGLTLEHVEGVLEMAGERPAVRWLEVARRVGVRELRELRGRARSEGAAALAPYEAAATGAGAAARGGGEGPATGADGEVVTGDEEVGRELLALPPRPPARRSGPTWLAVDPDLPEAAAWLLEVAEIPQESGFRRAVERDGHTCQNPLCGKHTLRVHAHHLVFRCHGGEDVLENALTVCWGCHLRLLHGGRVAVRIDGADLVWSYPGGLRVRVIGGFEALRVREAA